MTTVTLDLPAPPSVNRTRRIDWSSHGATVDWLDHADALVMTQKRLWKPGNPISRYELAVTLSEGRIDLDNGLKAAIDYLRRIEVVTDDAPQNCRGLTACWGDAPHGCRVIIRALA